LEHTARFASSALVRQLNMVVATWPARAMDCGKLPTKFGAGGLSCHGRIPHAGDLMDFRCKCGGRQCRSQPASHSSFRTRNPYSVQSRDRKGTVKGAVAGQIRSRRVYAGCNGTVVPPLYNLKPNGLTALGTINRGGDPCGRALCLPRFTCGSHRVIEWRITFPALRSADLLTSKTAGNPGRRSAQNSLLPPRRPRDKDRP